MPLIEFWTNLNIEIANVKRFILGICNVVMDEYLQYYLDEFIYKINKRFFANKFESAIHNFV
jgi:hypothetical protein